MGTQTHGTQHYMTPAGVSEFHKSCRSKLNSWGCNSSGAGLATGHVTMQNAMLENMSGCGLSSVYQ